MKVHVHKTNVQTAQRILELLGVFAFIAGSVAIGLVCVVQTGMR